MRYYLLAKAKPLAFPSVPDNVARVWRHIPGDGEDWVDDRTQQSPEDLAVREIRDFLDTDEEGCAVPDRVLEKWGKLFDIVKPSSRRTCCFTRGKSTGWVMTLTHNSLVVRIHEDG